MKTLRLIGIVSLAASLAGGLSGQDPAGAAAGTEFDQAVTMLKTFHRESKSGFENLKGERLKDYVGKVWKSTLGYPPVVNSLTRIYAMEGPYTPKHLSIRIQEANRESALLRLKLLSDAFKAALPDWTESEPPQTAEDLEFNADTGLRSWRKLHFEPEHQAKATFSPKAFLEVLEDLANHTFTTSLTFNEERTP